LPEDFCPVKSPHREGTIVARHRTTDCRPPSRVHRQPPGSVCDYSSSSRSEVQLSGTRSKFEVKRTSHSDSGTRSKFEVKRTSHSDSGTRSKLEAGRTGHSDSGVQPKFEDTQVRDQMHRNTPCTSPSRTRSSGADRARSSGGSADATPAACRVQVQRPRPGLPGPTATQREPRGTFPGHAAAKT
jgi:hypothetical protein